MSNIVDLYCSFPVALRRPMWKIWHRLLIRFDHDQAVNFMNYGYAPLNGEKQVQLQRTDERDRYCIQLYDHVVRRVDLENKKVLEVGSGRGGGASYIKRYYRPMEYTGVDISPGVIEFCNRHYNTKGLSFREGRAEKIPAGDEAYDAVVNVESARCYSDLSQFFREVNRVLVKDGVFLFADMIENNKTEEIKSKLNASGFSIRNEEEITANVLKGLELDNQRREELINARVPSFLRNYFRTFAGTRGTKRFESFRNASYRYMSFVLVKT